MLKSEKRKMKSEHFIFDKPDIQIVRTIKNFFIVQKEDYCWELGIGN